MARTLYVLSYDYVDDILERRTPHREGHLAAVFAAHEAGRMVLAGALGDPVRGGMFVFDVADEAPIEEFIAADPYVSAGLVTGHRIEPITAVVG